jgi:hypothetical protein
MKAAMFLVLAVLSLLCSVTVEGHSLQTLSNTIATATASNAPAVSTVNTIKVVNKALGLDIETTSVDITDITAPDMLPGNHTPTEKPTIVPDQEKLKEFFQHYANIMAIAGMVVGAVYCFFGWKLFRATLFVTGFIFFGLVSLALTATIIHHNAHDLDAKWVKYTLIGVPVFLGLLCGTLLAIFHKVGFFALGALLGVSVSFILNHAVLQSAFPKHAHTALLVSMGVLALALGFLAAWMERPLVIVSTAFLGSYAFVRGIGHFAGGWPAVINFQDITHHVSSLTGHHVWKFWAYIAGVLVLAVIGGFFQFRKAEDDDDERDMGYMQMGARSSYY